ncbi:MAG TPA: helix-turn-helix transcriptional regulator [Gemmatimonadaceae bacterium]|nr:helix-turn-helix transcriptional regulator [Gemmatimonadaceae bacterium]
MKRAVSDLRYRDDPLVAIRGDRVRAALERSGLTVSELARRADAKQQTVQLIYSGKTVRCRRSLRARIAKALAVGSRALGGALGEPILYWDEYDLAESPIAQRELWRAAGKAALRDKTPINAQGWPAGLDEIVDPAYWRKRLLVAPPDNLEEIYALRDLPQEERDELATMMADVMLLALRPWFDGRAHFKIDR